jgi:hypothetical protein
MLEQVTHTTPLRQGNIAATRSPKTVLLGDKNGAAARSHSGIGLPRGMRPVWSR